jgi:c-di-AMP phosphodiesterase-like protein
MQINAELVKKAIANSSQVIITSHRNLDLDALGSSLGLYYLCKSMGKDTCLLIDDKTHEDGVEKSLKEIINQKLNIKIKNWNYIESNVDDQTLLIIVDTQLPYLVQNEKSLTVKNKIVIDHHIESVNKIVPVIYEYIGYEQSSSVEIIIDLLDNLDIYIHPYVASVMLAGIFVDTNGFIRKTNYKTHESAAYLYKCNANLNEVQYLLKEDIKKYNDMQKVISEAKIINNHFIIATGHESHIYDNEDLAKISDAMLLLKDIEASFTIGYIGDDKIGISARSFSKVDVQKIMKKLNGGGHLTDAATQLSGETLESSFQKLKKIIEKIEGDF